MPRRSLRGSPKPPAKPLRDLKAAGGTRSMRLRGKPPGETQQLSLIFEDLESDIVKNWELPSPNLSTCVAPDFWPYDEPDPKKWPIDIVHLLHKASTIDLKMKGAILCSKNELFQSSLREEIHSRQLRNRSASGKKSWMTVTDLKKVIKHLESMAAEGEYAGEKHTEKVSKRGIEEDGKLIGRRGRSKADHVIDTKHELAETNVTAASHEVEINAKTRGQERLKKNVIGRQEENKPGKKRQASDLPIRPARKLRSVRSPKPGLAIPPPITPANPLDSEDSNEKEHEDQENEPPEPVSGRHIYGDFIKPTTIDFIAGTDSEPPAQAKSRQTRKRGRAGKAKPPTEEQLDSDPRDIDATGFLSELDPKEARRRRKPRLSRLQQSPVLEPAWSQNVLTLPETPLLTPAAEDMLSGTPEVPVQGGQNPKDIGTDREETESLAIDMLMELLPKIPDNATDEERNMLEDRIAFIHRDLVAYKTSVWNINKRVSR